MLARMVATDESALMCDFLETYHIRDFRDLPARQAGLYACGLREDSRIMRRLSGAAASVNTTLLAICADALRILIWQRTEDGMHGRNRPESILDSLLGKTPVKTLDGFDSSDEFLAWRNQMLGGDNNG